MKSLLIITEDVVKIQTLTGLMGRTYSRFFLFWFKLNLILKVWLLKRFYRVSVLTSDYFNLKQTGVYYYSQELSRLNYADKRLSYWQETNKILTQIKTRQPEFFVENGVDITKIFATRLCTYLAYNYLIYPQVERHLISRIKPDKVIHYRNRILGRFNDWLFTWLLRREYRQKLNLFLAQSQKPLPSLLPSGNKALLSLDFYRHLKTLKPIYEGLSRTRLQPCLVTDIKNPDAALKNFSFNADYLFLASFLPQAPVLAEQYSEQINKILKTFSVPYKPLVYYSLILSKLYLAAGKALFARLKPKRVVVISDLRYLENTLAVLANKAKIRPLMVSPNTLLDLAEINLYDTTDRVALPGEFIKDKLVKQGIASDKLTVVGDLQTINQPKLSRKQVYERLGLKDLTKKLILLISFRPNWLIPLAEKQKFLTWCAAAVKKFPESLLVIKPHPTEKRYRILEELKTLGLNQVMVADNQKLELVDLLDAASVVVQTWSMTVFEAVTLNCPVICVNPFKKDYDFFLPVIKRGAAVEVTGRSQLIQWLDVFQNDKRQTALQINRAKKAIAGFVRPHDGKEVQRVLELLA